MWLSAGRDPSWGNLCTRSSPSIEMIRSRIENEVTGANERRFRLSRLSKGAFCDAILDSASIDRSYAINWGAGVPMGDGWSAGGEGRKKTSS